MGGAFQFDGTVIQQNAELTFNFAEADAEATYTYSGPDAHCQVSIVTDFSPEGGGAGTGFGLTRDFEAGPGIVSTSPTIGGVQVDPEHSGSYVVPFTLVNGDVLVFQIHSTVQGIGNQTARVALTFTNIP